MFNIFPNYTIQQLINDSQYAYYRQITYVIGYSIIPILEARRMEKLSKLEITWITYQ